GLSGPLRPRLEGRPPLGPNLDRTEPHRRCHQPREDRPMNYDRNGNQINAFGIPTRPVNAEPPGRYSRDFQGDQVNHTRSLHLLMPYTSRTLDGRNQGGGCVDDVFKLGTGYTRQVVYQAVIGRVREQNPDKVIMPISFSVQPNSLF